MKENFVIALIALAALSITPLPGFAAAAIKASPTPTPFTIGDAELAKLTDEDMAKTEQHKKDLEAKHDAALDKVAEIATAQGGSLSDAAVATKDAKAAFGLYKRETEKITAERNQAIASLAHVVKQLHLAKIIANVLVIAIAGFIALKVPPPLGLYAAGAFAVAGSAAVWFFL